MDGRHEGQVRGPLSVSDLYERHAEQFDRARSRELLERPYLDAALERMPDAGRVLDLGCGGGEPIARYLIERGHAVTGVDGSLSLIDLCRSRFPDERWIHGDMRGLALEETFGLVVAWDSFFHLDHDDQRAIFEVFRQHTAPGGLLLFTSGTEEGVASGDLFGDELYHASLDSDEYRKLLGEHGYTIVLHRVEDPDCGGHTVWLGEKGTDLFLDAVVARPGK